jgi:hypothetical protein
MKIINTKVHGYLDYLFGLYLIAAPTVFGFNTSGIESVILYAIGIIALLYSLITDYELGLLKLIPMGFHLILDLLSGILLAASPWLFDFSHQVYLPHLILGLFEIGAVLMTKTGKNTQNIFQA